MTVTGRPASAQALLACSRAGISSRQGTHQLAQKLTTTTRPARASRSAWNWASFRATSGWSPRAAAAVVAVAPPDPSPDPPPEQAARPRQASNATVAARRPARVRSLIVAALLRRAGRRPGKGTLRMPKSRSKRRRYQPPPRPRPKPSPPWVGPTIVVCLLLGLVYILLFYMQILPSFIDDLGNINLAIGFLPLIVGLLLATRWT